MSYKIVVGGILERDGKLVAVKEKKGDIAGLWNFTLGGLEGNETLLDGCKREIEEESGCQVEITALLGIYQNPKRPNGMNVVKVMVIAKVLGGELACPEDIEEVVWMSFDDFLAIPDGEHREVGSKQMVQDYLAGKRYPLDVLNVYHG